MMPVIEYPGVVEEFVGFFCQDLSYYQVKRLKQYFTGLITDSKSTVSGIASRMVDPVDQSSPNRFLALYSWDEEGVNRRMLELLQSMEGMGWRRDWVIAVDDTLLPKAGKRMPGAGKLFDHSSGRFVHVVPRHEPLRRSREGLPGVQAVSRAREKGGCCPRLQDEGGGGHGTSGRM
jgi:hypothetical protein